MAGDPNNLTTLATLKAELKISVSTFDAVLSTYISWASSFVSDQCNRVFYYRRNVIEPVVGFATPNLQVRVATPIDVLTVPTPPLTITLDSGGVDPQTYFVKDAKAGIIFNQSGWFWTASTLPNVRQNPYPGQENPLYTITYSGGFVTPQQALDNPSDPILSVRTLPPDLEMITIIICVYLYRHQGVDPMIESEHLMSYGIGYRRFFLLPFVNEVLGKYKKWSMST